MRIKEFAIEFPARAARLFARENRWFAENEILLRFWRQLR
jgi:hypothetical protein